MNEMSDVCDAVTKLFAAGQFNDGDLMLAKYAQKLPDHIKLECLGNRHFYGGELQEAVHCYEEAIILAPEHPITRYQYLVGIQEEKEGNFVEAFKRYQNAIESDPTFINAYVELGGLLVKVRDFTGALQCYRDAVKLNNSDPVNLYNLKAILEKLVEEDPDQYEEELALINNAYDSAMMADSSITPQSEHNW